MNFNEEVHLIYKYDKLTKIFPHQKQVEAQNMLIVANFGKILILIFNCGYSIYIVSLVRIYLTTIVKY